MQRDPLAARLSRRLRAIAAAGASGLTAVVRRLGAPRRRLRLLLLLTAVTGAALVWLMSLAVGRAARDRIFTADTVPPRQVAVVFGAGVRPDGTLSAALRDRIQTGIDLYRTGRVKKLLMSGDNGRETYDEPTAMRDFAVAGGVPAADVGLDYAGFHTYDSCYRARAIFDVEQAVLVTQAFHLPRAIFTCQGLGIDAVGVAADRQAYARYAWYLVRETLARARAFVQVRITRPRPHFLGPKVPL